MHEAVDLNEISTAVSEIALTMPSALTDAYQQTLRAVDLILAAREESGATRRRTLSSAADAMRDARPEIPDDCVEDWDDLVETLEGVADDGE